MSMLQRHRTSAVVLTALAIAGLIAFVLIAFVGDDNGATSKRPAAAPAAPAAAATVGVTLKEFTVTPSPAVGRAGKVTFRVRNGGAVAHEFVVLKTATPAGKLLKGNEADETGNQGEIGHIAPAQTKTLALRLTPGHYALICNLPGHYQAGQYADFRVR